MVEPVTEAVSIWSERRGKWLLNFYPPLFCLRVRVAEVGPGFRSVRVVVRRSPWTKNLGGSTFGGAIFSGADPFYAVMFWQVFARRGLAVESWLKSATIRFRRPAASDLVLDFALSDEEIETAASDLERDGKFVRRFSTDAVDQGGTVCAVVETEVYVARAASDSRAPSSWVPSRKAEVTD